MDVVQLSSKKFMALCAVVAAAILFIGHPISPQVLGIEVLLTILSLFLFGSMKYQIHKNALTYGAVLIIGASFFTGWWPASGLRTSIQVEGISALFHFVGHYGLTMHGLDQLFHADTMLFILGLTFFVAVIAQTRLLESISAAVLRKNKGAVLPTILILIALVSFASGILDGVSMIGLLIRTMVIILVLAKVQEAGVIFSVIISTVITTVCGMWLAYGEPPNLIMKANLHPHLDDAFFLRYCLPAAVLSFIVVAWNVSKFLKGKRVEAKDLQSASEMADERFLSVYKHGEGETIKEELAHHDVGSIRQKRIRAQRIGMVSFIPFIGLLVWHAMDHTVPLYLSSFAGFITAMVGIFSYKKMRKVALTEAKHEYMEYLFLFPLFLSITLLQKSGFFEQLSAVLHHGIETIGVTLVAMIQYVAACILSALLDNNVVADFAARALHGLDIKMMHLFSMAQIAGYAAGGCWTHIGSAQSVVAFAFITREIDKKFSPFQWIKMMTPIILQISAVLLALIFVESWIIGLIR